jgi:hypothetical protein
MAHASKVIERLSRSLKGRTVSVGDVVEEVNGRSLYLTILVLSLPNLIPFLNTLGITHVTGLLLLIFISQLILGSRSPWLPQWLLRVKTKRKGFQKALDQILPYLRKTEKMVKPRWTALATGKMVGIYGLIMLALTIVLVLPIPFINVIPAVLLSAIALGLTQRDGIITAVSGILSLIFLAVLGYGLATAGLAFVPRMFS